MEILIYNIFPRLLGPMNKWLSLIPHIKKMHFNWVYVNPFHYPGFSGSLYAPKNYYKFNPLFLNPDDPRDWKDQLKECITEFHKNGINFMMDLVINHTAKDSDLVQSHPEWYKYTEDGRILSPGALDGDVWVEWGDLAEIDNAGSPDKENLWQYWDQLIKFYQDLGVKGFRCDAAYQVPAELWRFLIHRAKTRDPHTIFAAETLGCTLEETIEVANSGFDYIFNSSKYWNFTENWFLKQNNAMYLLKPSIAFPESHDSERLWQELNNNDALVKARYAFEAFISTGVMITIGVEFGFNKKCDVVHTTPADWENTGVDISEFIKFINEQKLRYPILACDGLLENKNPLEEEILFLSKTHPRLNQEVLFIINKNYSEWRHVYIENLKSLFRTPTNNILDISYEYPVENLDNNYDYWIKPGGIRILLGT